MGGGSKSESTSRPGFFDLPEDPFQNLAANAIRRLGRFTLRPPARFGAPRFGVSPTTDAPFAVPETIQAPTLPNQFAPSGPTFEQLVSSPFVPEDFRSLSEFELSNRTGLSIGKLPEFLSGFIPQETLASFTSAVPEGQVPTTALPADRGISELGREFFEQTFGFPIPEELEHTFGEPFVAPLTDQERALSGQFGGTALDLQRAVEHFAPDFMRAFSDQQNIATAARDADVVANAFGVPIQLQNAVNLASPHLARNVMQLFESADTFADFPQVLAGVLRDLTPGLDRNIGSAFDITGDVAGIPAESRTRLRGEQGGLTEDVTATSELGRLAAEVPGGIQRFIGEQLPDIAGISGALSNEVGLLPSSVAGLGDANEQLARVLRGDFLEVTPELQSFIQAATDPLREVFTEQTLPGLRSAAVGAGALGGTKLPELVARAGRDLERQIGDVTASIVQPAFEAERARQLQAAELAPVLAGTPFDIAGRRADLITRPLGIAERSAALQASPLDLAIRAQGAQGARTGLLGEQLNLGGIPIGQAGNVLDAFGTTGGLVGQRAGIESLPFQAARQLPDIVGAPANLAEAFQRIQRTPLDAASTAVTTAGGVADLADRPIGTLERGLDIAQRPLQAAAVSEQFAALPRQVQQLFLDRSFQEFLRQQGFGIDGPQAVANFISTILSGVPVQRQSSSSSPNILGPVLGFLGSVAGGPIGGAIGTAIGGGTTLLPSGG